MGENLEIRNNIFKDILYIFRQSGREGGESINVWLPRTHPQLGIWPATQACALTGNQTG